MSKLAVVLVLGLSFAALLAPSGAGAAPAGPRVVAQESPAECLIGEVCIQETAGAEIPGTPSSDVKDPAGNTLRTIIMLVLMGVAFIVYFIWAFAKSTIPAG